MAGQAVATEVWDGPYWAAVAGGLGQPPCPSQPVDGGAWVTTASGFWFVRETAQPEGFSLSVLQHADGREPERTVATVPGEPLMCLDEVPGFRRFALAVGQRVEPARLAQLAVAHHARRPGSILLHEEQELARHLSPALRIRVGELVPFRARMRDDGAWTARFCAYSWVADATGATVAVAVEDWEMRYVPQRTFAWAATPRGRPVPLA